MRLDPMVCLFGDSAVKNLLQQLYGGGNSLREPKRYEI